jgi:protein-L-isoaspartate(D-aspartate) O-methyltransferase
MTGPDGVEFFRGAIALRGYRAARRAAADAARESITSETLAATSNRCTITIGPAPGSGPPSVRLGHRTPAGGTVEVVVDPAEARERMVVEQLVARDIVDERVLAAMRSVPRHLFVPDASVTEAYSDRPLPIGYGVTISQPYIVALMTQALRVQPSDRVLEVGTGSGYGAAVLADLAAHVTTIEYVEPLADLARDRLRDLGLDVEVIAGDGSLGHAAGAPYDAISVTAAGPTVPRPLLDQLADGGRIVMPVGRGRERLVRVTRRPDGDVTETLLDVRFVPLRGHHGV